ncbi:LOW QUALITY PROTEIN: conserved hypothetical protein, partial [Streptomyces filamentosus NRRL 15998]
TMPGRGTKVPCRTHSRSPPPAPRTSRRWARGPRELELRPARRRGVLRDRPRRLPVRPIGRRTGHPLGQRVRLPRLLSDPPPPARTGLRAADLAGRNSPARRTHGRPRRGARAAGQLPPLPLPHLLEQRAVRGHAPVGHRAPARHHPDRRPEPFWPPGSPPPAARPSPRSGTASSRASGCCGAAAPRPGSARCTPPPPPWRRPWSARWWRPHRTPPSPSTYPTSTRRRYGWPGSWG